MPTIYVDREGAELIQAALEMFEAALTARVKRADPDQIISNSLKLQAGKLKTARQMLDQPDPPPFSLMEEVWRGKALRAAEILLKPTSSAALDKAWEDLRGLANAPRMG